VILWCDGAHEAAENMRRDAALLAAAAAAGPAAPAVLRAYRFEPAGITLGHAQDPARELDLDRCRRDGVGWAVRPTGGRAIFHADEWTYALAARLDDAEWGGSLSTAYARASRLLLDALASLGVPARLAMAPERSAATPGRGRGGPAAPCFASTARHEIVVGDRKLVGSAQRRTGGALLQQGSVLLGGGHLRLADYLALPEARRTTVREALGEAAVGAGRWLGSDLGLERWAGALEAALAGRVRRFDGASGLFVLTASEAGSYTPPFA